MIRRLLLIVAVALLSLPAVARNVTIKAVDRPAAEVFRAIVGQTGMNFVYSSDLLAGMKVTVDAVDRPLKKVLGEIFLDTPVTFSIKGNNVVLKRRKREPKVKVSIKRDTRPQASGSLSRPNLLDEVEVVSRLEAPAVETSEMGAAKITADEIRNVPVLLGEADVIKALHTRAGVSEGTEGLAGMYVHGGNSDENLCMLDNVPLYQVNHFGGLFSAFNPEIIRYIDFYKTSVPAKYDGRLSSFLDVKLKNGSDSGHHGSARLGLTSGEFDISGPLGSRTRYLVGLRRSWYDVLTVPILAIANSKSEFEKTRFRYAFMDFNAKLTHRFSPRLSGFVNAYYGNDALHTGTKDVGLDPAGWNEESRYDFNWGNIVAQAGVNYRVSPTLSSEFSAAYTRFFSSMDCDEYTKDTRTESHTLISTDNNIGDLIVRGDFDWRPSGNSVLRFGAAYTRHSFLPVRTSRESSVDGSRLSVRDSTRSYGADEANLYADCDWSITDRLTANAGLHGSLFAIDRTTRGGLSPRLSVGWRLSGDFAVKAAYSHTVQYVHQLTQSYLSLPTDQWVPVTARFRPKTADKIAVGGYWQSPGGEFTASVEAYYKTMRNLLDYRDEYYLSPPLEAWDARLTSGRGTARGVDFTVEKTSGRFTGRFCYSLAWADRRFPDKNGGVSFPARFDNRHTVNLSVSWRISDRVTLGAAWVGHSGNRFTLMPQMYENPSFGGPYYIWGDGIPLKAPVNNYQLPFYHRLDLSCAVKNRHGYWSFGLYNAYCHLNTVAVTRGYRDIVSYGPDGASYWSEPVFQKVKLLPIIPSISYTWQF